MKMIKRKNSSTNYKSIIKSFDFYNLILKDIINKRQKKKNKRALLETYLFSLFFPGSFLYTYKNAPKIWEELSSEKMEESEIMGPISSSLCEIGKGLFAYELSSKIAGYLW